MVRVLVVASVALCALNAGAQVDSLDNYSETLSRLESELGRVEQRYQGEIELGFQRTYEDRVSAGELYYLLGEYDKASTILFGAVEPVNESRASVQTRPGYAEALYQLGDSLFQLGNYSAASTYYAELLRTPNHGYRTESISGLLTIADRTNNYSKIDEYYRLYVEIAGSNVPSDVRYVHAKSLFLARRDREAVDELSQIPPGDAFYLRARYLIGATFVRGGDLEKSLEIFEDLIRQRSVSPQDDDVIELAHMARGRLYYELDQLGKALDAYQFVGWDSDNLPKMLYEVTWTYVRRGQLIVQDESVEDRERIAKAAREYDLALVQLDDLRLLADDDGKADIELLRGNLELQKRNYEEAYRAFEEILAEYRPADERMGEMLQDPTLRTQVLQDILAVEEGGLSVDSRLPPVAIKRAAEDPDVSEAIRVFREIKESQDELNATEEKLALLEGLLAAANRGERFPQLRPGFARAYTIDNNVLLVMNRLANLVVDEKGQASAALAELTKKRRALSARLSSLPETGAGLEDRKERFDSGFVKLERSLFELQLVIDQLRAELSAIDLLYRQSQGVVDTSPIVLERTKRRLQDLRAAVDEHEQQASRIREALDRAKLDNTVSGVRGSDERSLRDLFASLVEQELRAANASSESMRTFSRAQAVRERGARFVSRLNGAADVYIESVRRVVLEEKGNIQLYRDQVRQVVDGASLIREDATSVALQSVRRDLHNVVVRGDVGVIDVAFQKKQEQTEKIGALRRAKSDELTRLNQAYADLTADEEEQ